MPRTIWLHGEQQLTRAGAIKRLFALRDAGYLAMGGQMEGATVVKAWPAQVHKRGGF